MINCIKGFFDYDLVKKCCRCAIVDLNCNFHKDNRRKNGVQRICIICFKQYHSNRKEQRNALEREKRKTDFNFKLICNIGTRNNKAFKSQNIRKTNKTIDLIRCFNSFFKKLIFHQLCGKITLGIYGTIWCLDHCYPLSKTSLSKGNDMYKSTNWKQFKTYIF